MNGNFKEKSAQKENGYFYVYKENIAMQVFL